MTTPTIDEPLRCPCCQDDGPGELAAAPGTWWCGACDCEWKESKRRPAPPAEVAAAVDALEDAVNKAALSSSRARASDILNAAFAALRATIGVT